MAWLIKRKKKDGSLVYHIAYRIKSRGKDVIRSRTTGTGNKKQAQRMLLKFEDDNDNTSELKKIKMLDFMEYYIEYAEIQVAKTQKAENTFTLEKYCLNNLFNEYRLGNLPQFYG